MSENGSRRAVKLDGVPTATCATPRRMDLTPIDWEDIPQSPAVGAAT